VITDIYSAMAATQVSVGSNALRVFNYNALPNSLDSTKLPCRMLIPLGVYPLEGIDLSFISMGGPTIVGDWQIIDLFLYKGMAQGDSMNEFAQVTVEYIDAYTNMIMGLRQGLTAQAFVSSFAPQAGIWQWPAYGANYYAGVLTLLRIEESRHG